MLFFKTSAIFWEKAHSVSNNKENAKVRMCASDQTWHVSSPLQQTAAKLMLFNQNLLTPPTDGATVEGGNGFRYRVMTMDNNKAAINARDDSKHNNNLPTGLFFGSISIITYFCGQFENIICNKWDLYGGNSPTMAQFTFYATLQNVANEFP